MCKKMAAQWKASSSWSSNNCPIPFLCPYVQQMWVVNPLTVTVLIYFDDQVVTLMENLRACTIFHQSLPWTLLLGYYIFIPPTWAPVLVEVAVQVRVGVTVGVRQGRVVGQWSDVVKVTRVIDNEVSRREVCRRNCELIYGRRLCERGGCRKHGSEVHEVHGSAGCYGASSVGGGLCHGLVDVHPLPDGDQVRVRQPATNLSLGKGQSEEAGSRG